LSYLANKRTNKQTNKQTNKNRQKHNLLGGGNKLKHVETSKISQNTATSTSKQPTQSMPNVIL